MSSKKEHWENIYSSKQFNELSWYQTVPQTSINFLNEFHIPKNAKIIDIGGGDSYFVDNLLKLGYTDITVLDISKAALERCKERLGEQAERIKWIVADIANFQPTEIYDFWHDRAVFHFLTSENDIGNYIASINNGMSKNGVLVLGTFSEQGPTKCSGIEIKQYNEQTMSERLKVFFEKIRCFQTDHQTPFNTIQNFIFCSFRKLNLA